MYMCLVKHCESQAVGLGMMASFLSGVNHGKKRPASSVVLCMMEIDIIIFVQIAAQVHIKKYV